MIKDAVLNEGTFKRLFVKHFFLEGKQREIFIKCTSGQTTNRNNLQEHFYSWMSELKFLYSPIITEEQAINLITKHFPIAIQAYVQTARSKNFLTIWEKLDELENKTQMTTPTINGPKDLNVYNVTTGVHDRFFKDKTTHIKIRPHHE